MADGDRIVIVGAGVAGLRAAERLRELNFDGEIVLIGDEARRPYHRPMISKALVMGAARPSDCGLDAYLPDLDVHWRLGSRVTHLDTVERVVHLPGGESLWYDGLIAIPGCDKNMPGTVMAMGRLNRPSIMVYGGTIRAGCAKIRGTEEKLDIVSAFQSYVQSRP